MKTLSFNVPDEQAQAFAKDLSALFNKYGVKVENKEALDAMRPITERVKTYEDACHVLGFEPVDFYKLRYSSPIDGSRCFLEKDEVAYIKLKTIAAALNEGWEPQFTTDEYRWYPWFTLWTEEELKGKSEQWKKDRALWLFGGRSGAGSDCGLASAASCDVWSTSGAVSSARLAVKSEKLAVYFGKQFISIWADYVGPFNRKEAEK